MLTSTSRQLVNYIVKTDDKGRGNGASGVRVSFEFTEIIIIKMYSSLFRISGTGFKKIQI